MRSSPIIISYPNESFDILVLSTWNVYFVSLMVDNSSSLNFRLHSLLVRIVPALVIQEVGLTILMFPKKQSIYG